MKDLKKSTAYRLSVIALLAALMSGSKLALAILPNVEIVTLLLAVFAFCFGVKPSVMVAVVFCLVETLIWGFNTWVVEYFLHWPTVAVVFGLLGKLKYASNKHMLICATSFAVILTFLFGVMTSVIDTFLAYSTAKGFVFVFEDFFLRFSILYARGLVFFAMHVLSNCVLFSVAFLPLRKVMIRVGV